MFLRTFVLAFCYDALTWRAFFYFKEEVRRQEFKKCKL